MKSNLIDSWGNFAVLQKLIQISDIKITDTNGSRFARFNQLFHGLYIQKLISGFSTIAFLVLPEKCYSSFVISEN